MTNLEFEVYLVNHLNTYHPAQPLPAGKVSSAFLATLIAKLPTQHEQLLLGPAVGEDAAVIAMCQGSETLLVAKSDPITFATDEIGYYAVNVCANDLAVTGAAPKFYLPTILLPTSATTQTVTEIFQQIADACCGRGIVVAGGHSELTAAVTQPIVAGTMLGEVQRMEMVSSSGARPGDQILMAGMAPIEGASIIAREMRQTLLQEGWQEDELDEAAQYLYKPGISILEPALQAAQTGIVSAMHDPTEGGIITGLYELAHAAQVGLEIDLDQIPIAPLAARLCQAFDLDPLGTIASGALLATVPEDYVSTVLSVWEAHGWPAAVIGQIIPAEAGLTAKSQGKPCPFPTFEADELTKLWS